MVALVVLGFDMDWVWQVCHSKVYLLAGLCQTLELVHHDLACGPAPDLDLMEEEEYHRQLPQQVREQQFLEEEEDRQLLQQ